MADSVAGKRIIEFAETASIGSGDYIAVDNATQDTKKYDATKIATKEYADNAVSDAIDGLTIPTAKIEDGAVTTAKIADANVTTAKIANSAVAEAKIADSAVTSNKIANGSVGTAKLEDGAVNTDKLGAVVVTSAKIYPFAVGASQLASNAVTEAKVANNAVSTNKIANGAVTHDKLGSDAVMTANIANGSVTTAKINDSAVTTGKINDSAVTTAKINDSAVTTAKINNGAVTTDKLASSAVTEAKIGSGAVTEGKIGSGAVSTAKLADSAVTEGKLASSAVTTNKIADGAVTEDKLGEDVAEIFNNKAEINGYYDEMSVGSAEQLLSNIYETDKAPYLFRTSGGSLEIGDREYDTIVGASVAWNQLMDKSKLAAQTGSPVTFTPNEDGSVTVVVEEDLTSGVNKYFTANTEASYIKIPANHKYVLYSNTTRIGNAVFRNGFDGADCGWNSVHNARNSDLTIYLGMQFPSSTPAGTYKVIPQICDLTLMFGTTIADYIYTLEQSEAGSGIAWLKSYGFFTKDYYAYDAGSIQSVKTSGKRTVGFNQWDEVWESGVLNSSGTIDVSPTRRTTDYIHILPNMTYYISDACKRGRYVYYDEYKNVVEYDIDRGFTTNVITTPTNAYYLRITLNSNYGTTYNHDICINLHHDGERDGEYEPYQEHTYPLDSTKEWRGLFKLDANNSLVADGDIYASDGTVTRKYGIVDLGTLDWSKDNPQTNPNRFYTTDLQSVIRKPVDSTQYASFILCQKYVADNAPISTSTTAEKQIAEYTNGNIYISDSAYGSGTSAEFKTAMSGVYLVYELATPATESAEPFTSPQIVDNWGTEEYIDERAVPIPVGHETKYLPDLKAKLEVMPDAPSADGDYLMRRQNGENSYVQYASPIPSVPTTDGTYVLKATVASGTATLSWVAEE